MLTQPATATVCLVAIMDAWPDSARCTLLRLLISHCSLQTLENVRFDRYFAYLSIESANVWLNTLTDWPEHHRYAPGATYPDESCNGTCGEPMPH